MILYSASACSILLRWQLCRSAQNDYSYWHQTKSQYHQFHEQKDLPFAIALSIKHSAYQPAPIIYLPYQQIVLPAPPCLQKFVLQYQYNHRITVLSVIRVSLLKQKYLKQHPAFVVTVVVWLTVDWYHLRRVSLIIYTRPRFFH